VISRLEVIFKVLYTNRGVVGNGQLGGKLVIENSFFSGGWGESELCTVLVYNSCVSRAAVIYPNKKFMALVLRRIHGLSFVPCWVVRC